MILKGAWAIPYYSAAAGGELIPTAISTGIPVPVGGAPSYLPAVAPGGGITYPPGEEKELAEIFCPGSADNPTVNKAALAEFEFPASGILCLYAGAASNLTPPPALDSSNWPHLSFSGGGGIANFKSSAAGVAKGSGTWVLYTK